MKLYYKDELREHLGYVYDMERLSARVAYGSANQEIFYV